MSYKRKDHTLHHQSESASIPSPRDINSLYRSVREPHPWDPCSYVASVLEEVQVPPSPLPRIVYRVTVPGISILELCSFCEVYLYPHLQPFRILGGWYHLKALYEPWLSDA